MFNENSLIHIGPLSKKYHFELMTYDQKYFTIFPFKIIHVHPKLHITPAVFSVNV